MPYWIAVDLGGTNIRAARIDPATLRPVNEPGAVMQMLTGALEPADLIISRIVGCIRAVWPATGAVEAVGIGAPGPLNPYTGQILTPPNLPTLHGVYLAQAIAAQLDVKVVVGNDANAAALAEALIGAGVGAQHMIYLTVSTGIGAGVLIDGRLLLGALGLAAEPGVMPMRSRSGELQIFEQGARGSALTSYALAGLASRPDSLLSQYRADLAKFDVRPLAVAAQRGDQLAIEVIRWGAENLAVGVGILLSLFNPEMLVIGGGVSKLGTLLFNPMRAALATLVSTPEYLDTLRIESALLGDETGLVGAAALIVTDGGRLPVEQVRERLNPA